MPADPAPPGPEIGTAASAGVDVRGTQPGVRLLRRLAPLALVGAAWWVAHTLGGASPRTVGCEVSLSPELAKAADGEHVTSLSFARGGEVVRVVEGRLAQGARRFETQVALVPGLYDVTVQVRDASHVVERAFQVQAESGRVLRFAIDP